MADSWREIAMALGERMAHQAWKCSERHAKPSEHPECPYCCDTVVYERFVKKYRSARTMAGPAPGVDTPIHDQLRGEQAPGFYPLSVVKDTPEG